MKKIFKYILVLTALFSATLASAQNNRQDAQGIETRKYVTEQEDGTYVIDIEAWVTGSVTVTKKSSTVASDIVMVLDISSSMVNNKVTSIKYPGDKVNNSLSTDKTYYLYANGDSNIPDGYYFLKYNASRGGWVYGTTEDLTAINGVLSGDASYTNSNAKLTIYEQKTENNVTRLKALKEATKWFVKTIYTNRPTTGDLGHQVSIITYSNEGATKINLDLTQLSSISDVESICSTIDKLENGTGTRQDVGLQKAIAVLNGATTDGRNKIVVMFTDGEPYKDTSTDAARSAIARDAVNYAWEIKSNEAYTNTVTTDDGSLSFPSRLFVVGMMDTDQDSGAWDNYAPRRFFQAMSSNYYFQLNDEDKPQGGGGGEAGPGAGGEQAATPEFYHIYVYGGPKGNEKQYLIPKKDNADVYEPKKEIKENELPKNYISDHKSPDAVVYKGTLYVPAIEGDEGAIKAEGTTSYYKAYKTSDGQTKDSFTYTELAQLLAGGDFTLYYGKYETPKDKDPILKNVSKIYLGDPPTSGEDDPVVPDYPDNPGGDVEKENWDFEGPIAEKYITAGTIECQFPSGTSDCCEEQHDYYYLTAGAELGSIFAEIANSASESKMPPFELTETTAVVFDAITQNFKLPENATAESIKVYTLDVDADASAAAGEAVWKDPTARVEKTGLFIGVDKDTREIQVSGYHYNDNFVGPRTDDGVTTWGGQKLIIEIPIEVDPANVGGLDSPTNEATSGIYLKNQDGTLGTFVEQFEIPVTHLPYLKIVKYGLKMGESAMFKVTKMKSESTEDSDIDTDDPFTATVILTETDNDYTATIPEAYVKLLKAGYYRVEETDWSWTYTPTTAKQTKLLEHVKTDLDESSSLLFEFTNTENTELDHAEAYVINSFAGSGSVSYGETVTENK